jgi:hypothetical protein
MTLVLGLTPGVLRLSHSGGGNRLNLLLLRLSPGGGCNRLSLHDRSNRLSLHNRLNLLNRLSLLLSHIRSELRKEG